LAGHCLLNLRDLSKTVSLCCSRRVGDSACTEYAQINRVEFERRNSERPVSLFISTETISMTMDCCPTER
jgi:hypothetical protein